MTKYIDPELLRKEIEKNKNMIDWLFTEGDDSVYDGENDAYNRVLRIIDSLQQERPEVELEEEMDRFFEEMPIQEHENIFEDTYQMIARHFFELGLKAGKGEQI